MMITISDWTKMVAAFAISCLVAYQMTPPVKLFAQRVGAMDIPKDGRRVHDHPIPRMGGLAIFLGFVLSVLLFVDLDSQVLGLLLGAGIIAAMGAVDDIVSLKPWVKLLGQFFAARSAISAVSPSAVQIRALTPAELNRYSKSCSFSWFVAGMAMAPSLCSATIENQN